MSDEVELTQRELLEEIRKIVAEEVGKRSPYYFYTVKETTDRTKVQRCFHDECIGCKNGTCSGAHFLTCTCTKCSPRC